MGFGDAIRSGFNNYATFSGRAARPAYWYWILFTFLGSLVLGFVDGLINSEFGLVSMIFHLVVLIPTIALSVRRLHDMDYAGWWVLLALIPVAGGLILLVWFCLPGTPGPNRFG